MTLLGQFEIYEIFTIKMGMALAGKLVSGGPISNEKDILQKNVFLSFRYRETAIIAQIIQLDRLGRPGQDIVAEKDDRFALIIDNYPPILAEAKLASTIMSEIIQMG